MTDESFFEQLAWAGGITIAAALLLGASCQPPTPHLENAAAVNQYEALLERCRQPGRIQNSYAVYEQCADNVDDDLCKHNGLRCKDGGSP